MQDKNLLVVVTVLLAVVSLAFVGYVVSNPPTPNTQNPIPTPTQPQQNFVTAAATQNYITQAATSQTQSSWTFGGIYPCDPTGTCWGYGYTTIYGYITPSSGSCVYLSQPNDAGATYVALYDLPGNYPSGHVAVTGYYLTTQGPCSGTGFIVKSISSA